MSSTYLNEESSNPDSPDDILHARIEAGLFTPPDPPHESPKYTKKNTKRRQLQTQPKEQHICPHRLQITFPVPRTRNPRATTLRQEREDIRRDKHPSQPPWQYPQKPLLCTFIRQRRSNQPRQQQIQRRTHKNWRYDDIARAHGIQRDRWKIVDGDDPHGPASCGDQTGDEEWDRVFVFLRDVAGGDKVYGEVPEA